MDFKVVRSQRYSKEQEVGEKWRAGAPPVGRFCQGAIAAAGHPKTGKKNRRRGAFCRDVGFSTLHDETSRFCSSSNVVLMTPSKAVLRQHRRSSLYDRKMKYESGLKVRCWLLVSFLWPAWKLVCGYFIFSNHFLGPFRWGLYCPLRRKGRWTFGGRYFVHGCAGTAVGTGEL